MKFHKMKCFTYLLYNKMKWYLQYSPTHTNIVPSKFTLPPPTRPNKTYQVYFETNLRGDAQLQKKWTHNESSS